MYYTYILKSKINKSYYVGSCKDVKERLNLHNKGRVKSTQRYLPWKMIHIEEYSRFKEARKRETEIKSWKNRKKIEKLIFNQNFNEDPR